MAWPYVASWIAENRIALKNERTMRISLYALYNWWWRQMRLEETDSSEELLEDDDPQSHWPINDDEHIA
jgi:hypothetical protein